MNNNNKRLTPFESSLQFIRDRNEQRINNARIGDVVILDTLYANGVLRGFQHTIVRNDRIYPMERQHNISKANKHQLAELELSSSEDEEGFN